jgi:serine protease Do
MTWIWRWGMPKRILSLAVLVAACSAIPALAASSLAPVSASFEYSIGDDHATSYLGVDTQDLTPDRMIALHLKDEQGVEVTMVDQDAPAGKAGIKEHDVITNVNGEQVENVEQLRRLIREIPPGRTVTIGLRRDGQSLTIKAQLSSRTAAFNFNFGPKVHIEIPPIPNLSGLDIPVSVVVVHSALHSGLMLENLNSQLSDYFGVKNGRGILVRSVEKGTLAETAGFRAGDVIVQVNGQPVSDSSDFSRALRSTKGTSVSVAIIRDRKEEHFTFKIPEHDQSRMQEESFVFPQMSMNTKIEMRELNAEMAKLRPQIESAVQQAQKTAAQIRGSFDKEQIKKQVEEIRQQEAKAHHQLEIEMQNLRQRIRLERTAI